MDLSRRGFFAASALAATVVPSLVIAQEPAPKTAATTAATTATAAAPVPGQLTEEQLGNLLKAMGLKAEKVEKRFDFVFRSVHNKEDWDLSMTAVLSADNKSIWIMAWLDELPKSAADVPRTALLRLLAANDRLGHGKFFAYVASNRRFVMQRIIPNEKPAKTLTQAIAGSAASISRAIAVSVRIGSSAVPVPVGGQTIGEPSALASSNTLGRAQCDVGR